MPEMTYGMGWLHDNPDFRDLTKDSTRVPARLKAHDQRSVKANLAKVNASGSDGAAGLPTQVDLRQWFSLIEDQKDLGSCTANAGIGLVEYFERRAFGAHLDASRLFLYKSTRNLMGTVGDTGAYLRTTMAAMALFGVPPERYWPYDVSKYDQEPAAFLYAFAQNYQAISYYRLDTPGMPTAKLLDAIKEALSCGLPAMFGFSVYSSIDQASKNGGKVPFPTPGEQRVGGHAVVAVGYDDGIKVKSANPNAKETKGAIRIRNSWGQVWGEDGYGWLPYEYVLQGLAVDWWSLIKNEWVDTKQFG